VKYQKKMHHGHDEVIKMLCQIQLSVVEMMMETEITLFSSV
jgi:hypothetical protein